MMHLVDVRITDAAAAAPLLAAHRDYLAAHFASGEFVLFGAYGDGSGGALIAQTESAGELEALLALDPLKAGSCAVWNVSEFVVAAAHADKLAG